MTIQSQGAVPAWSRGDRLRKARLHSKMSTAELAEAIGVSTKTINNAEADKHEVRRILLNAWALATGVSVQWLQTGAASTGGPGGATGSPSSPGYTGPADETDELRKLTASKRSRAGTSDKRWYLRAA